MPFSLLKKKDKDKLMNGLREDQIEKLDIIDYGDKIFKGKGKVRLEINTFEDFVKKEMKKST